MSQHYDPAALNASFTEYKYNVAQFVGKWNGNNLYRVSGTATAGGNNGSVVSISVTPSLKGKKIVRIDLIARTNECFVPPCHDLTVWYDNNTGNLKFQQFWGSGYIGFEFFWTIYYY